MARRRRHQSEIVICVITSDDLLKFLAYDILLSTAVYVGLKRLHGSPLLPMAGSMFVPAAIRRWVERREGKLRRSPARSARLPKVPAASRSRDR